MREAEGQGDCRTYDTDTGVRPGGEDQGGPTKWLLLPLLDLQTKLQGIYYSSSVQSAFFIPLKKRLIVTFLDIGNSKHTDTFCIGISIKVQICSDQTCERICQHFSVP